MENFRQFSAAGTEAECKYTLTGANSQVLSISMEKGDIVHSEPGVMMMMSDDVRMGVECGKLARLCVGESLMGVSYTNKSSNTG